MARFVSLLNWTDQGAKTAADTADRAEAAQKVAAEMGGSLEIYWTMGQYDMIAITEFADDETAVAFLAKVLLGREHPFGDHARVRRQRGQRHPRQDVA